MINQEIADLLKQISEYLEMNNDVFRSKAYQRAAFSVEALNEDVEEIYEKGGRKLLDDIPGVGEGIAEKIEEYIKTGHIKYFDQLHKSLPVDLLGLSRVEGIGPKTIKKLYQKLKIKNVNDLERAVKEGKVRGIEGFGEKTEENILKSLEFLKGFKGRFVLGLVWSQIEEIVGKLKKLKEVQQIEVAGSVRRIKETVGDCDILIASENSKPVMDFFVRLPEVKEVLAHGETKSIIRLKNGLEVDLRVVAPESFGAAIQYFTGNKEHNIKLRKIAIEKGFKLNEYGLFKLKTKNLKLETKNKNSKIVKDKDGYWEQIAGKTEEEIYEKLGLAWVPPEMREDDREIELAQKVFKKEVKMPNLVGYGDLKGDLQVQTNWTDGENSIEEMAHEAIRIGLEYIVITDHTKTLAMTGGSDEKKLLKQMATIDKINSKFKAQKSKFCILKGAEVNILKDGSLDISDNVLSQLDIVGAAVHSHFNLSRKEQTERMKKAMNNKNIDIIFHPTGRVIGGRPAYELDMDEIMQVAKDTGTILEIDAYPDRLDLKDSHIRKAIDMGLKLAINSDAHNIRHLSYLKFGIAQARRGWAKKKDIINAWPLDKMLKFLK